MGSIFGNNFRITTFGESHGIGLGVIVDGMPAGIKITAEEIQKDLDRRKPGTSEFVTQRKESDKIQILSGIRNNMTLGSPIAMLTINRDAKSKDYQAIQDMFRPGHADYTYFKKYGIPPQPGGGRASGRETLARVAAGALAKALLRQEDVIINAYTIQIGNVEARAIDPKFAESHSLRCADPAKAKEMEELVKQTQAMGDSIGGKIELTAQNVPPGLGEPVFNKLDAVLAHAMLSIGAVKGIEFGDGFALANNLGSIVNDQISEDGFISNHAGGILGGISNGEPIILRLVIKPTPSISQAQATIDLKGEQRTIEIKGRHDPCICPRICPVAEAMAAIVFADAMLSQNAATASVSDEE